MKRIIRRVRMLEPTKIVSGTKMKILCASGNYENDLTVWIEQQYPEFLGPYEEQLELLVVGDDRPFPYSDFEYVASYRGEVAAVLYHLYSRPYIPLATELTDQLKKMENK